MRNFWLGGLIGALLLWVAPRGWAQEHNHGHDCSSGHCHHTHVHHAELPEGYTPIENPTAEELKALPFGMRLYYSRWSLHGEVGVSLSQLPQSQFSTLRTGFYLSATAGYQFTPRWGCEFGLSFRGAGGRTSGEERLTNHYLVLPVEVQWGVVHTPVGNLILGAGGYIGPSLSDEPYIEASPAAWDAGVQGRLIFEAGTFRVSAAYTRGLRPAYTIEGGSLYNQTLMIGVAICYGR